MRATIFALTMAALAGAATPAFALDADWENCTQGTRGGRDWDAQIAGCTRVLARGTRETQENRAIAYDDRAHAYYEKLDYEHAIADLDEAIRLDPKLAVAYNNRGNAYFAKGDKDRALGEIDRALEDANEAVKLDPNYAEALNTRAQIYERKGDRKLALADFEAALARKPENRVAREGRNRVAASLVKVEAPDPSSGLPPHLAADCACLFLCGPEARGARRGQ